jgi:maltose alpha-D-glucosyltransferase / alpha-amylase
MARRSSGDKLLVVAGQKWQPYEYGAGILEFPIYAGYDDRGRGIGTITGMTLKLSELDDKMGDGAYDWVWHPPFYPSGNKDRGYDVSDFVGIDPSFGTMADFDNHVESQHARGKGVITDLAVVNASEQHAWFQASRTNPDGPYGEFFIWRDKEDIAPASYYLDEETGETREVRNILVDDPDPGWVRVQDGWQWKKIATRCWFWDDVRKQYYWSRAKSSQPQLNYRNAEVRKRILDVLRFWAKKGVDAFRLDFLPFTFQQDGTPSEDLEILHEYLKGLRKTLAAEFPDLILIMESDLPWEKTKRYLKGDELHMGIGFRTRGAVMRTNSRNDATPIVEHAYRLKMDPLPPGVAQCNADENHDDLREQWEEWAEQLRMLQYYSSKGRGYRFVDNAVVGSPSQFFDRIMEKRKVYDLVRTFFPNINQDYYLGLTGSPAHPHPIGTEGDTRDRVRYPMPWNSGLNGGFSKADPARLYLPSIQEGWGDHRILNLEDELEREGSWIHWRIAINAMCAREPLLGIGLIEPLLNLKQAEGKPIRQFGLLRWLPNHDETLGGVFNISTGASQINTTLDPVLFKGFKNAEYTDLFGGEVLGQLNGFQLKMALPGLSGLALKFRRTGR